MPRFQARIIHSRGPPGCIPLVIVNETEGGYALVQKWDGDAVDVKTQNGKADRFRVVATPTSVLPSKTNTHSDMTLATPSVSLVFDCTLDGVGRPITGDAPMSPATTSSNLVLTKDGCLGQMTSDGFFVYEYFMPDGRVIDLRTAKILIPMGTVKEADARIDIHRKRGLLAHICELGVVVIDLHRLGAPILTKIKADTEPSCVAWITSNLLAIADSTVVKFYDSQGTFVQRIDFSPERAVAKVLSFLMCTVGTSLLLLAESISGEQFIFKYSLARLGITSGCNSKLAFLECSGQLMHLRISRGLFSAQAAEDDSTAISIRDHSFLWEVIDVPFDLYMQGKLNGPIRRVIIDPTGEWVAVAGKTGFCLCHMSQRRWKLFSDPREEQEFTVDHMTWVECGSEKLLAVSGMYNGQCEFWIISPKAELRIKNVLHRQVASKNVVALNACGHGQLGILSGEFILQIIKLSYDKGPFSMEILISASFTSFSDASLDPSAWKFAFISNALYAGKQFHLFVVQRGQVLFSVLVPPQGEEAEHRDIAAKILKPTHVDDFFIWQPSGQIWVVIVAGKTVQCIKWPFLQSDEFKLELDGMPCAFYPKIAGGLLTLLEQSTHLGWGERNLQRISINQTVSLIPAFLLQQLQVQTAVEFSETAKTISRSFGDDHAGEFKLLIELFLLEILNTTQQAEQNLLYRKLTEVLGSVLGPRTFRECLANFLRRIEISDATRILEILGPFPKLFKASVSAHQVDVAWSFFRISSAEGFNAENPLAMEELSDLLEVSYDSRNTPVLAIDATNPIDVKALKLDGPVSGRCSAVCQMLEEADAMDEAAIWSFVCDGDSTLLHQLLDSHRCKFSLEELSTALSGFHVTGDYVAGYYLVGLLCMLLCTFRQSYLTDPLVTHGKVSLSSSLQLPKQYFTYFYMVGIVASTALLSFQGIQDWLLLVHLTRRMGETIVLPYSANSRMHIIHGLVGISYYPVLVLTFLLCKVHFQFHPIATLALVALNIWQHYLHRLLYESRQKGEYLPLGDLFLEFRYTLCPHYMLEIAMYAWFAYLSGWSTLMVLNLAFVSANLYISAQSTLYWYLQRFPEARFRPSALLPPI
ncbi:hypothetical protein PSACC_01675 [Paramicrosporidium saccamoebae]|uniref:3-oxo-5-alpha-steroid 4-dehydrogenase C-terminal domain-containing protein n=1 Tax=Paramicrosporidium saccamoebae TaxID=1246581 RepID=A0A2H9TL94_9FUNG|nr:hypothetical protein PSACC_01675 [Paramicrosporidium saccamoebae]